MYWLKRLYRWLKRGGGGVVPPPASKYLSGRPAGVETSRHISGAAGFAAGRRKGRGYAPAAKRKFRFRLWLLLPAALVVGVLLSIHSFYTFDRQILPLVLDAAELRVQTEINNIINHEVYEIVSESRLKAADFVLESYTGGESIPVISVNTMLVNAISNKAAERISRRLDNLEPELVSVPMGMGFGFDTLAQLGPRFEFYLAPIGNATVSYESSFSAVGINQVHFSVWLEVDSVVRIINPVHSSEITLARHVSLVDTVISGVVPHVYLTN